MAVKTTTARRARTRAAPATLPRSRRVPVADTWPGRPTTLDGLRSALTTLAPDAPVLHASLQEWRETFPRKGAPLYLVNAVTYLQWNLEAVPRLLALLTPPMSLPVDPTAAGDILIPTGPEARTRWLDVGTEKPPTDPDAPLAQGPYTTGPRDGVPYSVRWWPKPAPRVGSFLDLAATPVTLVDLKACVIEVVDETTIRRGSARDPLAQLLDYLTVRHVFWRNARNTYAAYTAMAAVSAGSHANRNVVWEASKRYRAVAQCLDTLAPRIIETWAASIHLTRQLISAVAEKEGFTMPVSLATSSVISDLAAAIHQKITEGTGGRLSVPAGDTAFAWTASLAPSLLQYVTAAVAAGPHVPTVQVKPLGTVTVTPPRGTKPTVAEFSSDSLDLGKYAAIVSLTTEAAQFTANIEAALVQVMGSQIIRGIEADLSAAMVADGGLPVAATDLPGGILSAVAQVPGANLLALSPADFVELFGATGQSGYLNFSRPEDGPGTYLGLVPVIVPSLTAGTVLVADGRGVLVWELTGAPLCAVDAASGLKTNEVLVAIETWAGPQVSSPGSVAVITVTTTP